VFKGWDGDCVGLVFSCQRFNDCNIARIDFVANLVNHHVFWLMNY